MYRTIVTYLGGMVIVDPNYTEKDIPNKIILRPTREGKTVIWYTFGFEYLSVCYRYTGRSKG